MSFIPDYFRADIKEIELLVAILTFTTAAFFGALVFAKNHRSWTNRLFLILVLVFNSYTIINYISLHPIIYGSQFFWIRMVMVTSSFMGPVLFLFVSTFPNDKISLRPFYVVLILILMSVTAVLSAMPMVFKDLQFVNGEPLPVPGPGISVFFVDFAGLIILSFIVSLIKLRSLRGIARSQQLYLVYGILTSFTLIGIVTIVSVVILHNTNFVFLGPALFIVLIGFVGMAIVRFQLFDVKIIATNILVVILWIGLFSRILVTNSFIDGVIGIITLLIMIIFGILLIKSVKKEVEQRQHLEKLTSDLELANTKLKELDKVKSEFLSFASHQVKTPMSVVKGYATLIFDGTYGPVSDKIKETAIKIKETADNMIALVNNLLDLRKIESGKMDFKFEKIDLVKMLRDMVSELRGLAQRKGLDLSFETTADQLTYDADPQKLRQVFQNLIDNSIKYTDSGWIKVGLKIQEGFIEISVADSGRGISKELLPQLFEQFIRDAHEIKKIEGTGLGLYIAKQIVEAHHGQIRAESPGPDQGSVFHVKLPIK